MSGILATSIRRCTPGPPVASFKSISRIKGKPDFEFLERVFHKLLMNFTWWVNRKDSEGANIFEGGFLGLDNIGIFDRNAPLPTGWMLEQSDGSSWMAHVLPEHAQDCPSARRIQQSAYEDFASKFFEHFLYIADAINHYEGTGLWDEQDGFYYDRLRIGTAIISCYASARSWALCRSLQPIRSRSN